MSNKSISILIPIWGFAKSGGIKVVSNLANRWTDMGIDVKVVCFYKSIEPYYPLKCEVEYVDYKGRPTERENPSDNASTVQYLVELYKTYRALKRAIDRNAKQFTVSIANYDLTAYSVVRGNIVNKFYYIQAYEAWHNNDRITGRVRNWISRRSYLLRLIRIVNADIYKNYKEIKSKYVVPPGIDLDVYHKKKKTWDKTRPFIVGCIGREQAWKGSEDVAIAVEMLQNRGLDIDFQVAFHPVQHGKYRLVMPDGDQKLSEFYREIDVMIAPGTIQLGAIHYPVIEAMACNTPVITTGYYPANDTNAYIVPVSNPKAIADTIENMINNYDEAMDKADKAYACVEDFSWDKVSKKMLDIIDSEMQ